MADNRTHLMSQFYQQCQEKGYTDMRDGIQSLKAKVIATDLNLKYKDIAEFYEKARQCYNQIQTENERAEQQRRIQQQKEKEEAARRAVNGELLVTIIDSVNASSAQNRVQVFIRPDNSIYCTHNGTNKIEGSPKIGVEKGGVLTMTYHPSQAIYTGATVGGITTGGVHYTKDSYSYNKSNTGKGDVVIEVRGVKFTASIITMSEHTKQLFRRDSAYRGLVAKNGKIECFVQSEKADMYTQASLLARVDHVTAMNAISMAVDERRLPYNACVNIANLLGRIVNGNFPPSDEQIYAQADALSNAKTSDKIKRAADTFRSIADYKDAAERCKALDIKYEEVLQAEKEQAILEKEAQRAKNKKLAMILIPSIIVGIVALVLLKLNANKKAYDNALMLMEAGEYDSAIVAFAELGDFKDSARQIAVAENAKKEAEEARKETLYQQALALLTEEKYDEARAIFEDLYPYRDSSNKAEEAERLKEEKLQLEANQLAYKYAETLLKKGEVAAAAIEFGKLGDYDDSFERSMDLWSETVERKTYVVDYGSFSALTTDGKLIYKNRLSECDTTNAVALINEVIWLNADGTLSNYFTSTDTYSRELGKILVALEKWDNLVDVIIDLDGKWAVGLKNDGTIVSYGRECDMTHNDIMQVARFNDCIIVLKTNGEVEVVCGGTSWFKGAIDYIPDFMESIRIQRPDIKLSKIVNIKTLNSAFLAETENGETISINEDGRCPLNDHLYVDVIDSPVRCVLYGDGTANCTSTSYSTKDVQRMAKEIEDWTNIKSIAAGWNCVLGLKYDGSVVVAGKCKSKLSDFKDLHALYVLDEKTDFVLGIKNDGSVVVARTPVSEFYSSLSEYNIRLS